MSAIVEAAAAGGEDKKPRRNRGRRSGASRRRGGGKKGGEGGDAAEAKEPREKKERPPSTPVPPDFIGQTKTGVVSVIVRKGRVRFGFIHLCPGPEIDEAAPRIYFSFNDLADSDVTVRRGYIVTLKCSKDEQDRAYATEIALTEEGKTIAAEREAEIAKRKVENAAEGGEKPKLSQGLQSSEINRKHFTQKFYIERNEALSSLIIHNFQQLSAEVKQNSQVANEKLNQLSAEVKQNSEVVIEKLNQLSAKVEQLSNDFSEFKGDVNERLLREKVTKEYGEKFSRRFCVQGKWLS